MRSQARIIIRVSPKLESYFEDWLSSFEKEWDSTFQILKFIIEERPSEKQKIIEYLQKMPEFIQRMQDVDLTGYIIQDNITISREIIESIMKRLED